MPPLDRSCGSGLDVAGCGQAVAGAALTLLSLIAGRTPRRSQGRPGGRLPCHWAPRLDAAGGAWAWRRAHFDLSGRLQGDGLKTFPISTPEEPSPSTSWSGPGGQRSHGGCPACRELRGREGMLGVWACAMRIRWPRRRRKALAELARLGNAILVGVPIPRSCRGLSLDGGICKCTHRPNSDLETQLAGALIRSSRLLGRRSDEIARF
mmetsp:Transcript_22817/g.70904  ORF Transcript_22817/g.70904 Transcript_22817/m.70904 type:complete len:208 (-) Transcript_22817:62-685(-)